jgi:hypothetical protein
MALSVDLRIFKSHIWRPGATAAAPTSPAAYAAAAKSIVRTLRHVIMRVFTLSFIRVLPVDLRIFKSQCELRMLLMLLQSSCQYELLPQL